MGLKSSLAGPAYIVLNIFRVVNIIALLAVIAASTVMLVKTFVVSKFFFFDGVSHVITAFLSLFLIITELPLFRSYIARNWPLLSQDSGFITLGALMIVLGVWILGNLNKEATSEKSLGTPFWRIVISSGCLVLIMGVANIFASFIFRTSTPIQTLTARQVRAHGAVAPQKLMSRSTTSTSTNPHSNSKRRSFRLNRSDTLPSYHTSPRTETRQQQRNISAPVNNVDPEQFSKFKGSEDVGGNGGYGGGLAPPGRPDLAFHPALAGGRI